MVRIYDLKQKEVINIKDGCRFGYVSDVIIDPDEGRVEKIVIPGEGRMFGVFGREHEYHICWDDIEQIGDDLILVKVDTNKCLVDCDD